MNSEQWNALIRVVIGVLLGPGSYLVAKGVLTPDQANQLIPVLVPAVVAVGGLIIGRYAVKAHSPTAVVAAVNSDSVPGVKAVAEASPSPPVMVTPSGAVRTAPDTGKT